MTDLERATTFHKMLNASKREEENVCLAIRGLDGYPTHYVVKHEKRRYALQEAVKHSEAIVKLLS